jgi:hypothetical protein
MSVQVYGAVPPIALSVVEYEVPAVTLCRELEVTASGSEPAGAMVSEAVADLVGSALLVAVTVAVVLEVTAGAW